MIRICRKSAFAKDYSRTISAAVKRIKRRDVTLDNNRRTTKRLDCVVVVVIAGDQCSDCVNDYHLVLLIAPIYVS